MKLIIIIICAQGTAMQPFTIHRSHGVQGTCWPTAGVYVMVLNQAFESHEPIWEGYSCAIDLALWNDREASLAALLQVLNIL